MRLLEMRFELVMKSSTANGFTFQIGSRVIDVSRAKRLRLIGSTNGVLGALN